MSASIQYITSPSGKKTGVLISIEDWRRLSSYVEELRKLEEIGKSVSQGMQEVKLMQQGKLAKKTVNQFLDEL